MAPALQGVAFITGAGGALGRAIAIEFARQGVKRIAGLDLREDALIGTAEALKAEASDVEFLPVTGDMSDEEQIKDVFAKVVAKFGRIDYAINNAAIGSPFIPTDETATADFDRVQKINVKGTWLCEREELRQMLKQDPLPQQPGSRRVPSRGSIVVVSSLLGIRAQPLNGLYTLSKHAVIGMVRTDSIDYATKGIRINAVCPGFIDTPLVTPAIRELLKPQIDKTPMGRMAFPEEIADSVVYLASDRASYITGTVLSVSELSQS
ncbi:hypothetical protein A1O3_06700 [Capronia epimyces CBS 606.96]|uniref:3-oxoacyl-[acyl-carrier protein] reductase n=1 Tax=Capronia epimyces CBS 606.96 TaxID=1182542 RepID=W9YKV4_9EURO|nr:uncharacterized protein A1O3_06700 [Capronia epimyces CBS 606.96]EXJ82884.1 hypothetical protein A1O3_06700 [Capronia epimyces CBS 606.96]